MSRVISWLRFAVFTGLALTGCADSGTSKQDESVDVGTLALPLTTYGSSGVEYQLRDATFVVYGQYYYYDSSVGGATTAVTRPGRAGAPSGGATSVSPITLSSESDPSATSIEVELEQGSYQIYLQPGWHLDRIENGVATPVEAQLISGQSQWVYVSAHSTSWVSYQFGIGGRAIWFNGKLNVDVQVYESPEEYYGPSYGGYPSFAGVPTTAGAAPYPVGGAVGAGGTVGY